MSWVTGEKSTVDGYLSRMKHCGCMEDENKKEWEVMEVEKGEKKGGKGRGMTKRLRVRGIGGYDEGSE